jgi:hypothetical protein
MKYKKASKKKETASPAQHSSRILPQTKNYIEKFKYDIDPTYFTSDVEQKKNIFQRRAVVESGRSGAETWCFSGCRGAPLSLLLTTLT